MSDLASKKPERISEPLNMMMAVIKMNTKWLKSFDISISRL